MKKIRVFSVSGESKEEHTVPENLPQLKKPHSHALFEAVNVENQNRRQGTHDTKNKSEVSGTGKKPYRQKHTGRARQGSRRNPHFRGGGIAFGPTPEKNYKIRVNKKVSKLAFLSSFFNILESGEFSILDESFSKAPVKTKDFFEFLKKANLLEKKILLIANSDDKSICLSARNISFITLKDPKNFSVRDLLNQNYLLVSSSALEEFYRHFSWK